MKNITLLAILTLFLYIIEAGYINLAKRMQIIDKPNVRSLHSRLVVRGGGIIFVIAYTICFLYSNFKYPLFYASLMAISIISFLDDIFTLPNRVRLPFQFLAVYSILYEISFLSNPILVIIGVLIIGVGIINAYNFMDGINGITGGYSMIVVIALCFVNNCHLKFIENYFFACMIIGLVIFNHFNFRNNAKCFAGDVGSISIATIILFLLLKLIIEDNNIVYIIFLAVYGVDSILTIIHRLLLKENIFKAHRLHLFQVLVHTLKIPHLVMSSTYMLVQSIICYVVIISLDYSLKMQLITGFSIIVLLVISYIIIKRKVIALAVQ